MDFFARIPLRFFLLSASLSFFCFLLPPSLSLFIQNAKNLHVYLWFVDSSSVFFHKHFFEFSWTFVRFWNSYQIVRSPTLLIRRNTEKNAARNPHLIYSTRSNISEFIGSFYSERNANIENSNTSVGRGWKPKREKQEKKSYRDNCWRMAIWIHQFIIDACHVWTNIVHWAAAEVVVVVCCLLFRCYQKNIYFVTRTKC